MSFYPYMTPSPWTKPERPQVHRWHPLAKGLVGLWMGSKVQWEFPGLNDISGFGNNGTFGGAPTWIASARGPALSFDGTDDRLILGDTSQVESQAAISCTLWVRPTSLETLRALVAKFNSDNTQTSWIVETGTAGLGDSNDVIAAISTTATDGNTYGYTTANILANGTWTHIAMVFDGRQTGNANRLKIYANGIQRTLTFSGTIPASTQATTSNLNVAATSNGARYFNGIVDDIRIYNRALTHLEVRLAYENPWSLVMPADEIPGGITAVPAFMSYYRHLRGAA